jgi:hypothetical protein
VAIHYGREAELPGADREHQEISMLCLHLLQSALVLVNTEFSFRQLKDRQVVSFSPMFHWSEHNIRVHVFSCVLALQIAHLLRLQAERAGLHLSVRELLGQLAGIGETVLIYPTAGRGRPKARRMLTETTKIQDQLIQIFHLDRYAPGVRS